MKNGLHKTRHINTGIGLALLSASCGVLANPVYQPLGANLTYGDVTHGSRIQSASTNPASAAADQARYKDQRIQGTVLSISAGLEYGNVQELFDLYDQVTGAYAPSNPPPEYTPGQLPSNKPGGIDLEYIWDNLDPDIQEAVEAVGREVAVQTALIGLIRAEGYGKAFVSADAPFVIGSEHLGGTWTFGVNWSGSSKGYGYVQPIDFDPDEAKRRFEAWFSTLITNRPVQFAISNDIVMSTPTPEQNALLFSIVNDSSIITKSTGTTELDLAYSRQAWSGSKGSLYLGIEARAYFMQLSRLSVRFGDITDSEELFDAIRDSEFRSDENLGVDVGALWVSDNYQIGAQVTNVNEPGFVFPDVDLEAYNSEDAIRFLRNDQRYRMDRQLKLEASIFSDNRRWSAHLGYDADPATDPMGDRFQWLTGSVGVTTDSWWLPSARIGYRQNLSGTKLSYVGIGVTAFRILNIDISSAFDTVRIDGHKLPQGLMASIGFQIAW